MELSIYQINVRTESFQPPENKYPVLQHFISYDVGANKEEVLSRATKFSEEDEVYALLVNSQTIMDEIAHCKELIEYWQVHDNTHKAVIIQHQKNLIKFYLDLIDKCKELPYVFHHKGHRCRIWVSPSSHINSKGEMENYKYWAEWYHEPKQYQPMRQFFKEDKPIGEIVEYIKSMIDMWDRN